MKISRGPVALKFQIKLFCVSTTLNVQFRRKIDSRKLSASLIGELNVLN